MKRGSDSCTLRGLNTSRNLLLLEAQMATAENQIGLLQPLLDQEVRQIYWLGIEQGESLLLLLDSLVLELGCGDRFQFWTGKQGSLLKSLKQGADYLLDYPLESDEQLIEVPFTLEEEAFPLKLTQVKEYWIGSETSEKLGGVVISNEQGRGLIHVCTEAGEMDSTDQDGWDSRLAKLQTTYQFVEERILH